VTVSTRTLVKCLQW